MVDYARAREVIEPFEGCVRHMYLDINGFVTVGIGNMLPDAEEACALLFRDCATGTEARDAQITADYDRISRQQRGLHAEAYARFTTCDLVPDEILRLFNVRVYEKIGLLRVHLPEYETLPEGPQLALLDMAFNLGTHGLTRKFPKLMAAVAARDWATAAAECERPQSSVARNEAARKLFLAGNSAK